MRGLKSVRAGLATGLMVASLAPPSVALGASSPVAGYARAGGAEQTRVVNGNAENAWSGSGVLPFTGSDLWWLGGTGALLVGFGLLLAALARTGGAPPRQATAEAGAGVSRARRREAEDQLSLRR